jgi:predicted CXXCH cytochrome family protein
LDLYRSVRDPDHAASGFPTNCSSCHTPMQWSPARFDHAGTRFPLTGAHRRVPCASCHGDGVYRGKNPDCYACHRPDYEGTTDPGHVAARFPTACASCHNTTRWQGATFDHSATAFPLTGAHTRVACSGCHGDGVYQGKSTDCYACHKPAYDGTTDPNHAAAGFPTACANCHTTTSWAGATFDHDAAFFPIYSGRHRGLWNNCATCHNVPNNFSQFTCFSCHPHDDKAGTDSHHTSVSGYQYTSPACYSCHPRGNAG